MDTGDWTDMQDVSNGPSLELGVGLVVMEDLERRISWTYLGRSSGECAGAVLVEK